MGRRPVEPDARVDQGLNDGGNTVSGHASDDERLRPFVRRLQAVPGVVSGALFAFITSFDELVVAMFLTGPGQRTLPRQMFDGIRENMSPTILAVATILVVISILLLTTLELLRRRSERLRGVSPG